jgi:hypothetical protein
VQNPSASNAVAPHAHAWTAPAVGGAGSLAPQSAQNRSPSAHAAWHLGQAAIDQRPIGQDPIGQRPTLR